MPRHTSFPVYLSVCNSTWVLICMYLPDVIDVMYATETTVMVKAVVLNQVKKGRNIQNLGNTELTYDSYRLLMYSPPSLPS